MSGVFLSLLVPVFACLNSLGGGRSVADVILDDLLEEKAVEICENKR